jgi:hypothetical protein
MRYLNRVTAQVYQTLFFLLNLEAEEIKELAYGDRLPLVLMSRGSNENNDVIEPK